MRQMYRPRSQFRVCSEVLECRRRANFRRQKFSRRLNAFASLLAKRKRNQHGTIQSLNQIGERMARQVKLKDRSDDKLLTKAMRKHMDEIKDALQILKDATAKINVIYTKIAKTRKFNLWLAASKLFIGRIKDTLDLFEPWVHTNEVVWSLKVKLFQMSKYQTTTRVGWLQMEVKEMLTEAMERMFWV